MNFIHCPKPQPRDGERWTHTYCPPTIREEDIPDEHDVFETVAAAEEDSLEQTNLNLTGNTMTAINTTAAATSTKAKREPKTFILTEQALSNPVIPNADQRLVDAIVAGIPAPSMPSYHRYFDPIDMLEDHLAAFPAAHSRIMNSATWMLDMACINAARNIVFTRYAESELDAQTENRFGAFCQDIAEMLSHDSFYEGDEDSPEKTLATLMALSRDWHDQAAAAYAADNKDYNPKSFDELLLSEKPRLADAGTRANYEMIAKLEARGDAAKEARFMASFLEADRLSATSRSDDNKKLIPVLSITLSTVGRRAPANARFDHLPMHNQRLLTQAVLKSFDRVKLDMAKALKGQTIMFGHTLEAMYQCSEAMSHMFATKYTEVHELESASVPHAVLTRQRQIKAAAALRVSE